MSGDATHRTRSSADDPAEASVASRPAWWVYVLVGLGVAALAFAIGRFSIDARYTFGLTDLNAAEGDETKAKNRVLSVMAGWKF